MKLHLLRSNRANFLQRPPKSTFPPKGLSPARPHARGGDDLRGDRAEIELTRGDHAPMQSGRTHVSMILPVTTYGSMFDAGRRSSKYPLFSFSVIRGMRTYKRRRWGDGEATEQGAAARARGRGRYGKGV